MTPAAAADEPDPAEGLARESWEAVTPVCVALAVLFTFYLGFNLLRSPRAMTTALVVVQVATVAWFATLAAVARRRMPAPWLAQATGISIALAAALCATVTVAAPPHELPRIDVIFILLTSAGVGLAVHVARRRTHRRVRELRAKELAAQHERLAAAARLAGGLGHDFNNLLTVIQGEAMVLAEADVTAEERATALASLEETAARAAELTRQLLAFSRRQLVQPTRVTAVHELGKLERLIRRTLPSTIDVEVGCDAAAGMVIDAGQLGQAVLNLAINARDAMPEGGTLRLRASDVQVDSVQRVDPPGQLSSARRPGSYVAISVEDTGTGMDDETLSHLFEPFFTTKAAGRGTGLGLSMVHGIVHQHGGFVEVQSRVGRGTRFTLFVPAG